MLPAFLLMRVWAPSPCSRVACSTIPVEEQYHNLCIVVVVDSANPNRAACFNIILAGRASLRPHIERRTTAESSTMASNRYHLPKLVVIPQRNPPQSPISFRTRILGSWDRPDQKFHPSPPPSLPDGRRSRSPPQSEIPPSDRWNVGRDSD